MRWRPAEVSGPIELILFEHDVEKISPLMDSGIHSFLVDLEVMGKDLRQLGFDTDISPGKVEMLRGMAPMPGIKTWCRINSLGAWSAREIDSAIAHGVHVLILPMARDLRSVDLFLEIVAGRCETCIMLETREALALARALDQRAVDYAYFGLNDYRIDTGSNFLFEPIMDGTIETVRRSLQRVAFGFGGLTDMERGHPIPSIRFLEELERLDCGITFLRRSFKKDCADTPPAAIVDGIYDAWRQKSARTDDVRRADHEALVTALRAIAPHA
jgi:hypothetical protein